MRRAVTNTCPPPTPATCHVSLPRGTALPDKDYYESDAADRVATREKYTAHVARMLRLVGGEYADEAGGGFLSYRIFIIIHAAVDLKLTVTIAYMQLLTSSHSVDSDYIHGWKGV